MEPQKAPNTDNITISIIHWWHFHAKIFFNVLLKILLSLFSWQTILSNSKTHCHKYRAEHYLILIWNYYHYLWLLCVGNPIKMNRNTFNIPHEYQYEYESKMFNVHCSLFIHECVVFLVWLLFILSMLFTLHSSGNAWIQFDPFHIHILTPLKMITHHNHHNNFSPMTTICTYSTLPTPSPMLFSHNECFYDENWCTCIIYDEFWIGKNTI